jgi:Spy/CpxP family protein refolding chaperone
MRNLCKATLTLALVALMASPALAQRQRPGGGRGGFGRGGNLLTNKSVQEELKLSKDQKDKLEAINKEMREAFGKLRDLSQEERREKMQALIKESAEKTKKVRESLTSEQKKRLKQIETQQRGIRAFSDKKVQEALKLTDEQKTAIKEIGDDVQKKVAEETKDLTGRERFTKGREIRTKLNKEAMGKIAAKLTAEQKKTWKELVGAPFEIKFERPMGPGGRRPGGRRDI